MKYYVSFHRVIMPKYGVLPSAQMEILWWVFHYKKSSQQPIEAGMALADWVFTCMRRLLGVLTLEAPLSSPFFIHFVWHCLRELFKHQDISSLVIISFILMTCMFDQAVLLSREIGCWSLLGLKGLMHFLDGMLVHHRVVTMYSYTSMI